VIIAIVLSTIWKRRSLCVLQNFLLWTPILVHPKRTPPSPFRFPPTIPIAHGQWLCNKIIVTLQSAYASQRHLVPRTKTFQVRCRDSLPYNHKPWNFTEGVDTIPLSNEISKLAPHMDCSPDPLGARWVSWQSRTSAQLLYQPWKLYPFCLLLVNAAIDILMGRTNFFHSRNCSRPHKMPKYDPMAQTTWRRQWKLSNSSLVWLLTKFTPTALKLCHPCNWLPPVF
jgi:hypothetical protein